MRRAYNKERFGEFIAVVVTLSKYEPNLPPAEALDGLNKRKKLDLIEALDIAQSRDDLASEDYSSLAQLFYSLPDGWPGTWASFIRRFHAVARGQVPTVAVFDVSTNEVELQELPVAVVLH